MNNPCEILLTILFFKLDLRQNLAITPFHCQRTIRAFNARNYPEEKRYQY